MENGSQTHQLALALRELAYDKCVLYVEDDKEVQGEFKLFLSKFFKSIDLADDGECGLRMATQKSYDLIITDISMPVMNGVEMIREIRAMRHADHIIVTSAHTEADMLLTVINLGVDGFILKPLDSQKILQQLLRSCQIIHDRHLLEHYLSEIEQTNFQLAQVHDKMAKLIEQGIEAPVAKTPVVSSVASTTQEEKTMKIQSISAEEFHRNYPIELDKKNEDLENLEDDYEMLFAKHGSNVTPELLVQLTAIINKYSEIIEAIPEFTQLAIGIEDLATTFESISDPAILQRLMPIISSLFDTLNGWRLAIFVYKNASDIHYVDNSILSDAIAIKSMLGVSSRGKDDDNEIDLF